MKNITRKLSLFLAILTLTSIFFTNISVSANSLEDPYAKYIDDTYMETTNNYIKGLTDRLIKFIPSKNVCIDYLYQEILLHRLLLFTSYTVEQYTKNPELLDITDDITDYYSGQLKELRDSLPEVINSIKSQNLKNDDADYMKDYKGIVDKMILDLSSIKNDESFESTYIKQSIAILEAIYSLSNNSLKYSKNTLTKEISESIVKNTPTYISRLQTLQKSIK